MLPNAPQQSAIVIAHYFKLFNTNRPKGKLPIASILSRKDCANDANNETTKQERSCDNPKRNSLVGSSAHVVKGALVTFPIISEFEWCCGFESSSIQPLDVKPLINIDLRFPSVFAPRLDPSAFAKQKHADTIAGASADGNRTGIRQESAGIDRTRQESIGGSTSNHTRSNRQNARFITLRRL